MMMLIRPPSRISAVLSGRAFRLCHIAGARGLSSATKNSEKAPSPAANEEPSEAEARMEAYRQVQNLDFMTAAKILFTAPPKKKFGLDFHLVQLFFACMPSLAVYLVAQYARYEIRRMEAEVEEKKKQVEEEEKAKQAEEEEKVKQAEMSLDGKGSDDELSKVIVRLDALEETVKEIVDEKKKKISPSSISKDQAIGKEENVANSDKKTNPRTQSETEHSQKSNQGTVSGSKIASKENTRK